MTDPGPPELDRPELGHQWASLLTSVAAHRPDRRDSAGRARPPVGSAATPVTLLTGFLGAGKSTVLARLLSDPGAVGVVRAVVNDVGRLPFDPALVDEARSDGQARVELTNGCGCCAAGAAEELGDRLEELAVGADLVVLEASGMADPVALAQIVAARPALQLDRVVTVVDARAVDRLLTTPSVAPILRRQLDAAEAVVLSHTDDLTTDGAATAVERLRDLALGAPIIPSTLADPADRVLTPEVRIGARVAPEAHRLETAPTTHSYDEPPAITAEALRATVDEARPELLRAKGRLVIDGRHTLVQVTPSGLTLTPDRPGPLGLTVVAVDGRGLAALVDLLGPGTGTVEAPEVALPAPAPGD